MTELTIYRCDICGLDFDDKELCYRHENFHEIQSFIEKENVKFCHNGHRISIYKYKEIYDLLGDIDAIEVSNPDIARKINKFYYEKRFNKPFENEDSKRVYFDENNAEWLDADMIIKNVESKFGK